MRENEKTIKPMEKEYILKAARSYTLGSG